MSTTPINTREQNEVLQVLALYPIDTSKASIMKCTLGYVNTTYIVETDGEKYVLRKSNPLTKKSHIQFEIALLQYLEVQAFPLSPKILPNIRGKRLTTTGGSHYILQSFVTGSVKASWNNHENYTIEMHKNFFHAFALFTHAVKDFTPTKKPKNKTVEQYAKIFPRLVIKHCKSIPSSPLKLLIEKNHKALTAFAKKTSEEMAKLGYSALPHQCVHYDLHPGNVHFDENNEVTGIFDYDWAGFDSRYADIASTLAQSAYIYGGPQTGKLRPEYIRVGLRAYEKALPGNAPFTKEEKILIKTALQAYYLFQLLWAVDFARGGRNPEEDYQIVAHFINTCLINDFDDIFGSL